MLLMNRPQRPFKNRHEAKKYAAARSIRLCNTPIKFEPHEYPCLHCHCEGRVRDPKVPVPEIDYSRPTTFINTVMSTAYVICPECLGSGRGSKARFDAWCLATMEDWRQKRAEYLRLNRLRRTALKKLDSDEIDAIRKLGVG